MSNGICGRTRVKQRLGSGHSKSFGWTEDIRNLECCHGNVLVSLYEESLYPPVVDFVVCPHGKV